MRWLAICVAWSAVLPAQPLAERIGRILESSAVAQRAFWGIRVLEPGRERPLFELHPDHPFVPASNTKLFTSALALRSLGPDYRFQTRIFADREPAADGTLEGDLRLIGGGDPTLSARAVPYKKGPAVGDPLRAIDELAGEVYARGVRRIEGDVVGDDTAYVWEPYPEGWAIDDGLWEYGAPVSALTINDNSMSLSVAGAGQAGEPAQLLLSPPLEYYRIDNRVRTAIDADNKVYVERLPGSLQLRLWGALAPGQRSPVQLLAIQDPALYAAQALVEALRRRGVAIRGRAIARHRFANEAGDLKLGRQANTPAGGIELARRESPPLVELLQILDKVSQNLHTELMLRQVGRVRRNIGSREAGLEELRAFLAGLGIGQEAYHFADGSGLSRRNLVTAAAVTTLLRAMVESEFRDAWLSLLPVGGEDGTLEKRFAGQRDGGRIRAKTGTLSHVSALSGYAESRSKGRLIFAILVNSYNGPSSEIRAVTDKICLTLIE